MRIMPTMILVTILAVSCAKGVYIPDGMDIEEKFSHAVLMATSNPDAGEEDRDSLSAVAITKLDGKNLFDPSIQYSYPQVAYLTPGPHTIHVRYFYPFIEADGCLQLDAIAGETYFIRKRTMDDGIRIWLENANTGAVVGSICGFEKPPSEQGSNPQI